MIASWQERGPPYIDYLHVLSNLLEASTYL